MSNPNQNVINENNFLCLVYGQPYICTLGGPHTRKAKNIKHQGSFLNHLVFKMYLIKSK